MSNTAVTRPARTTMHAIVQNRYGTSEVLHPAQIERPDSGGEVLVQVRAAGLSRAAVSA
jgi:NADPH:quinone reductase-like Zn-dependent oxidoreductase